MINHFFMKYIVCHRKTNVSCQFLFQPKKIFSLTHCSYDYLDQLKVNNSWQTY